MNAIPSSSDDPTLRRVLRREIHAARTVPAVVAALLALLMIASSATLAIWSLASSSRPVALPDLDGAVMIAIAVVAAVVGIVFVLLAVLPGHRARRFRIAERLGLVADDGVLADATAAAVAVRCGLPRRQVRVVVGRRVDVDIVPTSGRPLDEESASQAAVETLAGLGFALPVRVRARAEGRIA